MMTIVRNNLNTVAGRRKKRGLISRPHQPPSSRDHRGTRTYLTEAAVELHSVATACRFRAEVGTQEVTPRFAQFLARPASVTSPAVALNSSHVLL